MFLVIELNEAYISSRSRLSNGGDSTQLMFEGRLPVDNNAEYDEPYMPDAQYSESGENFE